MTIANLKKKFLNVKVSVEYIGLVRNFLRFFRKFPRAAEKVLEYSLLRVYIDGMNTV